MYSALSFDFCACIQMERYENEITESSMLHHETINVKGTTSDISDLLNIPCQQGTCQVLSNCMNHQDVCSPG